MRGYTVPVNGTSSQLAKVDRRYEVDCSACQWNKKMHVRDRRDRGELGIGKLYSLGTGGNKNRDKKQAKVVMNGREYRRARGSLNNGRKRSWPAAP